MNTGNPGNNRSQKKDGYRFVVDNTGEVTPFDWYNARISVGSWRLICSILTLIKSIVSGPVFKIKSSF